MARVYIAINGDDVGGSIGNAIASNDHMALNKLSTSIKDSHSMIEDWIQNNGGEVITSSGDEGLYVLPEEAIEQLEDIRAKYAEMSGHTLTIGVGNSMADASKALIYGKLNEKDQIVQYEAAIDEMLSDDQVEEAEQVAEAAEEGQQEEIPVGQQKEVLNEEQMETATPAKEPLDTGDTQDFSDPDDNIEGANNEVGEADDQDQFVDESANSDDGETDPDNMIEMVVDQETDGMENDEQFDENSDGVEDEATMDMDNDGDIDAEDDQLASMVEEDMSEEIPEEEMYEEDMSEEVDQEDGHADIKGAIMETLQIFRAHKGDLDLLATANPELHAGLIGMLQHMIEMGKRMQSSNSNGDADELNQFAEEFPDAEMEEHVDAEEDQDMIEENMDEHNEEMHGEDPDEDSAITDDEDPDTDATPDSDDEDSDSDDSDDDADDDSDEGDDKKQDKKAPFPPKKSEKDKGKLEKK